MPLRSREPGALVLGSDFRALAAIRALGRRGIPCLVVDDDPRSAWFSRHAGRRRWRGTMQGEEFLRFLVTLARGGLEGWVLFPLQDETVETVARATDLLAAHYRLTTPPWEVARHALDKRLTQRLAASAGVPAPRTWYPDSEDGLGEVQFPAIVKPASSVRLQRALGRKAFWARDRSELEAALRAAAAVLPRDQLMVQEAIPGGGLTQVSVAAFCHQGQALATMTARRWRQYPIDFGLGSSYVEAVPVPGLEELARAVISRLGLSGACELEFKQDPRDGKFKLLDLNLRLWGWHGLCVACGLDFTHLLYQQALGLEVNPPAPTYGWRWRRLLTDLPAALMEMRVGRLSAVDYLGSFGGGRTVRSVLDASDPGPALGDLAVAVVRAVRRRRAPRPRAGAVGTDPARERPSIARP
jgi:D-aspartate ligase